MIKFFVLNADFNFSSKMGFTAEDKLQQDSIPTKSSQEQHQVQEEVDSERVEPVAMDGDLDGSSPNNLADGSSLHDVTMLDGEFSRQVESVKQHFIKRSEKYSIPQLERLYTRIMKGVFETKDKGLNDDDLKTSVLGFLLKFVEDDANF
jgi:hypothetical protein